MKTSHIFFIGLLSVFVVFGHTEESTFEGSGNADEQLDGIIPTDDEDLEEIYSASGMDPTDKDNTIETEIVTMPDYKDEPEVSFPDPKVGEVDPNDLDDEGSIGDKELDLDEDKIEILDETEETSGPDIKDILDKVEETEEKVEDIENIEGMFPDLKEFDDENKAETNLYSDVKMDVETTTKTAVKTTAVKTESVKTESVKTEAPKVEKPKEEDNPKVDTDLAEKDPKDVKPAATASIFSNNQFLVAIIIGGCIGLLFAICVILLVVYRLKKKDEGSYALDDQQKLASPSCQYTQGQEYFA